MREILFKAKRIDNGEWVEGYYQEYPKGYVYIQNSSNDWFSVYPNTICQYTGLTDLNGNKIWENDIVRFCDEIYRVEWDEDDARFSLEDESIIESFNNIKDSWCDVIGNIFDNPELLKEGGKHESKV